MKICMLLDNPFSPIDRRVYREARTLVENGHAVTVVCKKDADLLLPTEEYVDGIRVQRLFRHNLGTSVQIDYYLAAHFDLIHSLTETFDVYHCHDAESWPIGYILSRRNKAKFVCDAHEYFPDFLERENYADELKYETSKLLWINRGAYIKQADAVITVGAMISQLLRSNYALTALPEVIYNSRSLSEGIVDKSAILRQQYAIPAATKILLFHGNIEHSRGIENLMAAIRMVSADVILLLAGACPEAYLSRLHAQADALGISHRFRPIGHLEPSQLLRCISSADINLYYPVVSTKNIQYSAPNKFFDYIFAGAPFILPELDEMAALCRRYDIGYICSGISEMAGLIDKLSADPDEYQRKQSNFARAQSELCWENQETKLLRLYQNLCAE